MKKALSIILVLSMLLVVLPLGTFTASAATSGYYTYTVSNGEATITDVNMSISGAQVIPSELGGYPVTCIGDYAFSHCNNLKNIVLPDSVTSIGDRAFYNCASLTSINIPEGVTNIGSGAFYWCTNLTNITIPDSVTSIGRDVFVDCSRLTSITVDTRNANYSSINGVLFNKKITDLLCYPAGKTTTSYSVPNSVISICNYAFRGCSRLTSINLPDSITSIGNYAFYGCSILESVTTGNSVISIGNYAFYNCYNLTSITIPNGVTSIGDGAFYWCSKLTRISIPDSVTSIGDNTFYDCSNLTDITIPDNLISIGEKAFQYCKSLKTVWYVGTQTDRAKILIGNNNSSLTNATWHYITGWEVDLEPSCTEKGIAVTKDIETGEKIERYIDALGHNISEWEVDLLPTCTEEGIEIGECTVCGEKEVRSIAATGHTFGEWEVTLEPTCTEKGLKIKNCGVCGKQQTEELSSLGGHTYGDWKTEIKPTCTRTGLDFKTCNVCGDRQEKVLPAIDHSFSIYLGATVATCNQNGSRIIKCVWCGERSTTETECGHIYKDGKCVSCDISAEVVESSHNYDRNTNQTWTVIKENASALNVTFSAQTETEAKYDIIYIYDGVDNLIGEYSGTTLAGQTITVSGDTVKIKFTSDGTVVKYGFHATIIPESIVGDTNGDGAVNALDMLNIQDAILMGVKTDAYDITGDGLVNLLDLVRIKKILAGKA